MTVTWEKSDKKYNSEVFKDTCVQNRRKVGFVFAAAKALFRFRPLLYSLAIWRTAIINFILATLTAAAEILLLKIFPLFLPHARATPRR